MTTSMAAVSHTSNPELAERINPNEGIDQIREIMRRTRQAIAHVQHLPHATLLVRRSAAAQKMALDALKVCRLLEREQFELKQEAAETHLRTQRCAGELLMEQAKNRGGRPVNGSCEAAPSGLEETADRPPTLRDLGIDPHESHRWQRIASIPAVQFEEFIVGTREQGRELTIAAVIHLARQLVSEDRPSAPAERAAPDADLTARGEYYRSRAGMDSMLRLDPRALAADLRRTECDQVLDEISEWHKWITELMAVLKRRSGALSQTSTAAMR
jgi:hypothetical protein